MKSQNINLLRALLLDAERTLKGYSADRDMTEVSRRVEHEGDSFLTKTLPALGDFLLDCLSERATPVTGWKQKSGFSHPEFLHGMWSRIVEPDLSLKADPCVHSILFIRQITATFKKVFEVCEDVYITEALKGFVVTDWELGRVKVPAQVNVVSEVARRLFSRTISEACERPGPWKHGPGAVAEKYDSIEKYSFKKVSPGVIDLAGIEAFSHSWGGCTRVEVGVVPARLISVPKTALKPRLIAIEPTYNQFIQQGYHTTLKASLGQNRICGYLSQEPNQRLAREGSIDGGLSTIDLSEASDRVSYKLLKKVFGWSNSFLEILESTRSTIVTVPKYGMRSLHKFACMGSALTFPVEAMYFTSIVVAALCIHYGDITPSGIARWGRTGKVRVYGDDIIIPTAAYPTVVAFLKDFGLVVNEKKSFSTGLFRESCGADWYKGVNITPSYLRRNLPTRQHQVKELLGLAALRDQFYSKHLFPETVSFLTNLLRDFGAVGVPDDTRILQEPTSYSRDYRDELSCVGVIYRTPTPDAPSRWNRRLQRSEYRFLVSESTRRETRATSTEKIFKFLYEYDPKVGIKSEPKDPLWLSHDGRPTSAKLKRRWVEVA